MDKEQEWDTQVKRKRQLKPPPPPQLKTPLHSIDFSKIAGIVIGSEISDDHVYGIAAGLQTVSSDTDPQNAGALRSLMNQWQNTPPSWGKSDDPCGTWEGVQCTNSKVTALKLSTMGLKGTLSGDLGQLTTLQSLDLSYNTDLGGSLTRNIGNLKQLTTLALNSNKFSGPIPASLGSLSKLYWLDLGDNQLSGTLPVSTSSSPGLDQLVNTKHLWPFQQEPAKWSHPREAVQSQHDTYTRLYVSPDFLWFSGGRLFDNNQFTGNIPASIGSVLSLEVLRLDKNTLTGPVPSNISNLVSVNELAIESGEIQGTLPTQLFSLPQLQQVLLGNPICSSTDTNTNYCRPQQTLKVYSTSHARCGSQSCPADQSLSPQCICAYPYEGILVFRAPFFRDLSNSTTFQSLETNLWKNLTIPPGSVSLQNIFFTSDNYLQVQLQLFPSTGLYFNRSEIQRLGFELSNQSFKPPPIFGPYYFIASRYPFPVDSKKSISAGLIAGVAVGCAVLILGLVGVGIYAFRQKKRAERAMKLSKPFVSWAPSGKETEGAPQLKGARWFSYDELKKCTNNFSDSNEIGSGGYGKVYRGMLPNGQIVAIKRAQQGSMQGGLEFKTEIELLSRVHHKNLVALVGFSFEQGERMLVYEFVPNGTLREAFTGHYGLMGIMDPTIRNATNLIGFGRFVELAMQCVEESAVDRPTMNELVKEIESILQNDGINTNMNSASSSATDFGITNGVPRHPYNDPLPKKDISSNAFEYSGGISFSANVEPK
ncbi:putative leucine-rich repeat receptor-like protein kinase [Acorus gramineus]|uniref:non-specific serine/threonine protein kinase n=1 Tax=Acorus gramineus TaxID=55184 RepID=A0AAV9B306_ACOGR|nr:putative leucine-rich repeat receptor-like protein kinase [Acorus gramineus]